MRAVARSDGFSGYSEHPSECRSRFPVFGKMRETDLDLQSHFTAISPTQREKAKTEQQGEVTAGGFSLKPKNEPVTNAAGTQWLLD